MVVERKVRVNATVNTLMKGDQFHFNLKSGKLMSATVIAVDDNHVTCMLYEINKISLSSGGYKYSEVRDYLNDFSYLIPDELRDQMVPVYGKSDLLRLPLHREIEHLMSWELNEYYSSPYWLLDKVGIDFFGNTMYKSVDKRGLVRSAACYNKLAIRPIFKLKKVKSTEDINNDNIYDSPVERALKAERKLKSDPGPFTFGQEKTAEENDTAYAEAIRKIYSKDDHTQE